MAALRLSLQRDLFQPNDERLLGLLSVTKPHKKKKVYFLTLVYNDMKKSYLIYLIKTSDQYYKKHTTWPLNDLRIVDGKHETRDLELHFCNKQIFKWIANAVNEKLSFLQLVSRIANQLSHPKIEFVNLSKHVLLYDATESFPLSNNVIDNTTVNNYVNDDESYQALTSREEADLERMMEQCEFTIHNAEAFTEQLSREVTALDSTNIHNIMASEQRVIGLMQILQSAVDETIRLEGRINHYETLLKSVKDVVLQVEQKEAIVQTQNDNNQKLLNELDFLINQMDFSRENEDILLEGSLTSRSGIALCIAAAKTLQDALNANIHPALLHMNAVQEQRKSLEKTKVRFSSRLSHHLSNLFSHLTNQYVEDFLASISNSELTLPDHSLIHNTLRPYAPLMKWLRINDKELFTALMNTYKNYMGKQYEREIRLFFELIKDRLSSNRNASNATTGATQTPPQTVESRRKTMTGNESLPSSRRSSNSIAAAAMNPDQFTDTSSTRSSEISMSEWEEFDACIERMLITIDPVIQTEQKFCSEFFDIEIPTPNTPSDMTQPSSFTSSPSPSNMSHSSNEATDSKKNEQIRFLMGDLFSSLEVEFLSFVNGYDKMDGLYSLYLLVRLTQHVLSAQDAGSFISKTYGNILIQVKRNFDKFMLAQQSAIQEAKAPKRPKCGVLPFLRRFELFAKQAENIYKRPNVQRRADIDRWYTMLVRSMFDAITRLASEHHKTPSEMIRLENYHYLHNALSALKIQCLENERKESKHRYNEALKDYVSRYFGRPLEKLNIFFEGVQQKVAQGVKEEEIGYQLAFSKQELRKIINNCSLKEVKKGLEEMYRKVEKHACEPDTNLVQVIWRSMQEEFISQYKAIQEMIERCYPDANITLAFTIGDVLGVFSEIAQSH